MTINKIQSGRDSIGLLKGIFKIPSDLPIASIELSASVNDVTTMVITCFAEHNEVDVESEVVSVDPVGSSYKYEITVTEIKE